jgi:K+-sensing histidine kinase KdpD
LINFPAVLASSVHDIKNSLTTVRELIIEIAAKNQSRENHDFIQLEFEANRMNNSLIQLLELYKIDSDKFSLSIDEYTANDILQEVKAQQAPLLALNNINLTIDCENELICYCDYDHVCNALGSILNNALRYSNTQLQLTVQKEKDYIVFCMEDDGKGYPEKLLAIDPEDNSQTDWISGSTGLGLHFVATIAALHTTNKTQGYIKIDNNSRLGGARFRLFLP